MIENRNIIYFSADDWGCGLITSQTHIARVLSRDNRILYINSIGLRRPSVSARDARKIINKLKKCLGGIKQVDPNVYVVTPLVIPLHGYKIFQLINRKLLVLTIRYYLRKLKFSNPILWTFLPNTPDMIGRLNEEISVYYCVDEFSEFAGVPSKEIKEMEKRLMQSVDYVFCTSRELYEKKRNYNKNTNYMPHGVEITHFRSGLNTSNTPPSDIRSIPGPRIGFYGAVEEWVDLNLLEKIAKLHPDWHLVLVGRQNVDIGKISSYPNVHLLGQKSYDDLPAYSSSFDVAMIPFVVNELTRNVNPIKLREYLAAGNPVVSTYLPELEEYRDVVVLAKNDDEFIQGIEISLKDNSMESKLKRSNRVQDESWEARLEKVSGIILDNQKI